MSSTGLVLVHGGLHAGDCWTPTIDALTRLAPDVHPLAVDLPGRREVPGDLSTLTIEQCETSVIEQIDAAGLDRVMLVGHSMAGITIPGVAARLGAERVARLVFVAADVPADGESIVDGLSGAIRYFARRRAKAGGVAQPIPRWLANRMFCNGMTAEQRAFTLGHLHPDSPTVTVEPVHRSLPDGVPLTWVRTLRDKSLSQASQNRSIAHLGGVDDIVEIDTCHNVMISEPDALARVLLDRL
ncbi:MAG: putative esterase [Aeromicrobium sp.]|nr:putative esterase [Aeromicrobium sp.]